MTERKIRRFQCQDYVGTIRDAKLKKGLNYCCNSCTLLLQDKIRELENKVRQTDMFDDIFGGGFKGKY